MSNTKIKAGQFYGVVGNGTNGYFLVSDGNGGMSWVANIINPTITNVDYPGVATAADPAGGETVILTGTGFKTGATVTIGGTAAPSVSYVSATQLTITTPAKTAGDYDIVVTNTDTGSATYINGISYNGIPAWTTAAGSLGTFASGATISTITLQASEPDAGTITFNITNGALPTGLSLTGANINGTTSLLNADTLYTFTVTATDDESQATPRTFTITVQKQFLAVENFSINTYTGNSSTNVIEGKIGTAAVFNGSSSRINTTLTTNYSNLSISCWVNFSALPTGGADATLVGKGYYNSASDTQYIHLRYEDFTDQFTFGIRQNSTYNLQATSGVTASINTWYHVVGTLDSSGNAQIYVNGVAGTGITSAPSMTNSNEFQIGSFINTVALLNGKIDQVRIFNKVLSSSEVTTLYGESNTSSTKSTTDIFADGSGIALYEFEKGAIDTGGVSGKIGSAGIFNGSSSKIEFTSAIPTTDTDCSFSLWLNLDNVPTTGAVCLIGNQGSTTPPITSFLYYQADGVGISFERGYGTTQEYANNYSTASKTTLTAGVWYNITAVYTASASTAVVYLNGSILGTHNLVTQATNRTVTSAASIGSWSGGNIITASKIDQVRFFTKALSSSEVTTLYGETSASTTKSTTDIFGDGSGVALYELEGNANDTGNYPLGTGSLDSGQSAAFNGSSSTIGTGLTFSPDLMSFTCWAKPNADTTVGTIFENRDGAGANYKGIHFGITNNERIYTRFDNGAGNRGDVNSDTVDVPTDRWTHLAFTIDMSNSIAKVYKNGEFVYSESISGTFVTNRNFNFGNYSYYSSDWYNGSLDDARVYSDILTASEIEYIAKNDTANIPTGNLVAHYKLDGNANNESGTNGTASNITYSTAAVFPLTQYNGTATNVSYKYDGTPTNVGFTGLNFQPDLVWAKSRNGANNHNLYDSIRGATYRIFSHLTNAQDNLGALTSFDSNGFTLSGNGDINQNYTYVAWCFKGGGTAVSNTDGSITSTVSANQAAGFSIVKYTGNGGTDQSLGHGLSSPPELVLFKRTNAAVNWFVFEKSGASTRRFEGLNTTLASTSDTYFTPSDSTITWAGSTSDFNGNTNEYIMYCFHSVDGYQKIGSYTGNGSSSGQTITGLGFNPRFLLVKNATNSAGWRITDKVRGDNIFLYPNSSSADDSSSGYISLITDGFRMNGLDSNSVDTYIYLAIA